MTDTDTPTMLAEVNNLAGRSLGGDELASWTQFAKRFLDRFLITEWADRNVDDVFGAVNSSWQMLQQYSAAEPDVRLFNPSMQEHGWCSPHTVLQVH